MLRLVLIENLRRLCGHMLVSRALPRARRRLARSLARRHRFHACLARRRSTVCHSDHGTRRVPPQLDRKPIRHRHARACRSPQSAAGNARRVLRQEQQRLAANQVSIGNLITSMRLISALDWSQFFERVSLVEQVLRRDPAGVYAEMDFATRDQYRHVIEHLAKGRRPRRDPRGAALDLALRAQSREHRECAESHIGYYHRQRPPRIGTRVGLSASAERATRTCGKASHQFALFGGHHADHRRRCRGPRRGRDVRWRIAHWWRCVAALAIVPATNSPSD